MTIEIDPTAIEFVSPPRKNKKKRVNNIFCPTGKGGGIDPTCKKGGKGGSGNKKVTVPRVGKKDPVFEAEPGDRLKMSDLAAYMKKQPNGTTKAGWMEAVLDRASKPTNGDGKIQRHGMAEEGKDYQTVTVEGIDFNYPPDLKRRAAGSIALLVEDYERGSLPSAVMKATESVTFTTQTNKDDAYWQERFGDKDHVSHATGGDGHIVVYRGEAIYQSAFAHESGHNLATRIYGTVEPMTIPAGSDAWGDTARGLTNEKARKLREGGKEYAQAQDVEPAVTEYGKNSSAEDFAEAVMLYTTHRGRTAIEQTHPKKYAALKAIFEAYE